MSDKKLTIAVDFDGTLCEYAFPEIGEQRRGHKILMSKLIQLRNEGHKLILWTNRGDNDEYPVLTEAVDWCRNRGLLFDAVNENLPNQNKLSGYSPKVMADIYIDDRALEFNETNSMERTLNYLNNI